jgi:hypothetical protein
MIDDDFSDGCKSLRVYTLEEANELFDNVEGVEVYLKADIDSLKEYYLDAKDNPEKYPEIKEEFEKAIIKNIGKKNLEFLQSTKFMYSLNLSNWLFQHLIFKHLTLSIVFAPVSYERTRSNDLICVVYNAHYIKALAAETRRVNSQEA